MSLHTAFAILSLDQNCLAVNREFSDCTKKCIKQSPTNRFKDQPHFRIIMQERKLDIITEFTGVILYMNFKKSCPSKCLM